VTAASLRRARRDAGLSQAELADALGVATYTVSRWEGGHDPITPRRAREIRDALGMT
jgi:transcriptional regulator with XRE-family HTH domain